MKKNYKIEISDVAKLDLKEAAFYYQDQQIGLGKKFLISIMECIHIIKKNPELYQIRFRDIRFAYPKTFPYLILYYINNLDKQITIIAILHSSQNPNKWLERNKLL